MGCRPLVTTQVWRVVRKHHAPSALLRQRFQSRLALRPALKALAWPLVLLMLLVATESHAIPPNTPITNTATASFTLGGAAGSVSDSVVVTTDAASGNSAPTGVTIAPASVLENSAGALVGTITVIDLDPGDTHTVTVDDSRFEVVGGDLRLVSGVALDFETEPTVSLTFTITDMAGAVTVVTRAVTVVDVNEPPAALALDNLTLAAGTPGAAVGALTVTDPDAGDTHILTVDDARFEIVGGTLKLLDSVSLPLGTVVTVIVTATDSGGLEFSQAFTITAVPPGAGAGSDAQVRFFANAPGVSSAVARDVGATQCATGTIAGPLVPVPAPLAVDGSVVGVPGVVPLTPSTMFRTGTGFFVEVIDPDANFDNTVIETAGVDLTTASGDAERIVLTETAASSGVFLGYFSSAASSSSFDCSLTGGRGQSITARYVDPTDPTDAAVATAVTDPISRVFLSSNGMPLDGVGVQLVDAAGNLASVRGDDGVATFPSSIMSGGSVMDSAGVSYVFGTGEYYFPFVAAGDYQLQLTLGNRFAFPTVASDAALQGLPGAPFALSAASRGATFAVAPGPVFNVDLPVDLLPITPSASSISLLAYAPGNPAATTYDVPATQCMSGSTFVASPPPNGRGGIVPVPGMVALLATSAFGVGEPVFVQLVDSDQDIDPFAPDFVVIDVRASSGDVERVRLTETGASTGTFIGWIDQASAGAPNDCDIDAQAGATIDFDYVDATNAADRATASALVSPASRVFTSSDGAVLDGATITLIDTSTGLPATNAVFADDGVTSFPATVVSGADAVDGSGTRIDFAPGTFRFPVVLPGSYRFDVTPPPGYLFPSVVDDAALSRLPGAPFTLDVASRGATFALGAGATAAFDLPLDAVAVDAFLTKVASKDVAAIGDFVQYQVRLSVPSAVAPLVGVMVQDDLPRGFRYVDNSAHLDGARIADPRIERDGRRLTFDLPALAPGTTPEIRYVTEIGGGARPGRARNTAQASGPSVSGSNVASAVVTVREELFTSRSILVGEVMAGACDAPGEGVRGVRILMEDGTFVVTDEDGKYHIEGLTPGTHVVQVDLPSVPATHQLVDCAPSSRGAGRTFSRFIDLAAGTLWREDFRMVKKPPVVGTVESRMLIESDGVHARIGVAVRSGAVAIEHLSLTVLMPEGVRYQRGSALRAGAVIDDPVGIDDGALTFRMGDLAADSNTQITFVAEVDAGVGDFALKSLAQFQADGSTARTPVAVAEVKQARVAMRHESRFEEADVALSEADRQTLAAMVAVYPGVFVDVVGHADSQPLSAAARSRFADNYALSKARAETVAATLSTTLGLPQERIYVSARGADEPQADDGTKSGRAANRRAAVVMVDESPATTVADSGPVVVEVTAEHRLSVRQPIVIPELPSVATPVFDGTWLAGQDSAPEIVWPPEGYAPRIPAIGVVVKHSAQQRLALQVNGVSVNALSFEGTETDARGIALSRFRNVALREGTNRVEATLSMGGDSQPQVLSRRIHFSGVPVRAEFVPEHSNLVADGITPPVLAVRLYDRDGEPVRPGLTGNLAIAQPYRLRMPNKPLGQMMAAAGSSTDQYLVRDGGIAYIELEPTPTAGRLMVSFSFGEMRTQDIRARIAPATRDWVLVGFGEGTVGYGNLSGHSEPFGENEVEADLSVDGRTAFYAKGRVRGDMLLTLAYDSDNSRENTLGQQIDPNRFYTLYGDGAEQNYDASSQRKLYVRLERDDFFALFGDFETGFDETELARYSRNLNGAQGAYYGERVRVEGFAAETDQGYFRDQIQGDGTSGIYRLSRGGLVVNSESLRIEVRDRIKTEVVLDSRPLSRFLDYSIDFDRGTFFTKRPVPSQDLAFNPTYIVAEYEVRGDGGDAAVVGMRAAVAIGPGDSEAAVSVVHDDTAGAGSDLVGVDLRYALTQATELRVEGAVSDTDANGRGTGYLAEVEHQGDALAGRVYARQQELEFGLGQQTVTEAGTRKIGAEGEYLVTEAVKVRTDVFQQRQLDGDGFRRVAESRIEHASGQRQLSAGLRAAQERAADGRQLDGNHLVLGASQGVGDGRLTVRSAAEVELSAADENTDYPNRLLFGADYRLFDGLTILGEQEFTFGDRRDTQDTRIGIAAQPWTGAEVASSLQRQHGENGDRLFATTGLLQQWQVNERWQLDFGVDRVQTINSDTSAEVGETLTFNPNAPPASGGLNNDFSAFYMGGTYRRDLWDATTRLEYHQGDIADKWNALAGASRQLAEGRVVAASFALLTERRADGGERKQGDLRVGFAWRPAESVWSILNRLDLTFDELIGGGFDTRTRKLIENFNLNYAPDGRHQLALQLGLKYALETIDSENYDGVTSLTGLEYRFDLTQNWDVGIRGSALHSFAANSTQYSTGLSVGHSPVTNMWVSVGYNVLGFEDRDFTGADYTAQGPYLKLRFKVDQSSIAEYLDYASFSEAPSARR